MSNDLKVTTWLIPKNKWTRPGDKITPTGMAIHWTGNIRKTASAKNNATFFHNRKGSFGSAQYILDDKETYLVVPENEMAYHVGATKYYTDKFGTYPNKRLIGLEICVNMDADWDVVYDRAVRFAAQICKSHKWNPKTALVRHYDVTRKDCPLMWTPLVHNDSHVRNSVISMLLPKKTNEDAQVYKARLAKNESTIKDGIKWIKSLTANGKLGDDGWNQFIKDVIDAMNGVFKKTVQEKVVYYMGKFFADVDDNSWKASGINALAQRKLSTGATVFAGQKSQDGKHLLARPDDNITRAETAILIERAIGYVIEQVK